MSLSAEKRTVCELNMCTGCGLCADKCHSGAITIVDSLDTYNAVIDAAKCNGCNLCVKNCPNNNPITRIAPITWWQGWSNDENIRSASSSGGAASAIATAFVKNGGVYCSCRFMNGEFVFDITEAEDDIKRFAGSKYVKSNPKGIYDRVLTFLKKERKVLFVGLPCQVAAMRRIAKDSQYLYTIDLICHGTPSPKLLDLYLSECGKDIKNAKDIKFREKNRFYVSIDTKAVEHASVRDRYTLPFLRSMDYTENCYSCSYATIERCADITLGDSWGSNLPEKQIEKGISLILVMSDKGKELLDMSDMHLESVDEQKAINNNQQLRNPARLTDERNKLFATLSRTGNFNRSVFAIYKRICIKQRIKLLLLKLGLKK